MADANDKKNESYKINLLDNFMEMMQLFQFAPPSDNIWTVSIGIQPLGNDIGVTNDTTLGTLYNAIISANDTWKTKVTTKWGVDTSALQNAGSVSNKFLSNFAGLPEIFLAQDVSFSPIEVTHDENFFSQASAHGSFFNFGSIAMARPANRNLNISFLISNWNIADILFDPWIAAVGQRGLIEDGKSSSIKARIIIKEYAQCHINYDKQSSYDKRSQGMQCVKQFIFNNCVPIKRGEITKNYEFNDGGTFKKTIVNFVFDDYKIQYLH